MATDINAVIDNLCSFYDMRDKSVLHVGAGGGQLIGYAKHTRSILAVDNDRDAVTHLETAIQQMGLTDRFRVVHGEFSSISDQADVVFFEFCLHEMDDPDGALLHAQSCAPEILVMDHHPDSTWAWHTCEEEKAARSWAAVRRLDVVGEVTINATQHFETHSQLVERVQVLGEQAIARTQQFAGQENIEIEMGYTMALLRGTSQSQG